MGSTRSTYGRAAGPSYATNRVWSSLSTKRGPEGPLRSWPESASSSPSSVKLLLNIFRSAKSSAGSIDRPRFGKLAVIEYHCDCLRSSRSVFHLMLKREAHQYHSQVSIQDSLRVTSLQGVGLYHDSIDYEDQVGHGIATLVIGGLQACRPSSWVRSLRMGQSLSSPRKSKPTIGRFDSGPSRYLSAYKPSVPMTKIGSWTAGGLMS